MKTYYEDSDNTLEVPFAVQKLLDVNLAKRYDISGCGVGNDHILSDNASGEEGGFDNESEPQKNIDLSNNVNDLQLDYFRNCLIHHFNIAL